MIEFLAFSLKLAGAGFILLAIAHVPLGRHLNWKEDTAKMTPANHAVFHVHNLFICVVLVAMGLPCLLDSRVLLEPSRAGLWGTWTLSVFWAVRLYCQWFVYPRSLWQGKRMEGIFHWTFTGVWTLLVLLFAACGLVQLGWFR